MIREVNYSAFEDLIGHVFNALNEGDEVWMPSYLGGQVRADTDGASLGGHLEGETNHPFDLEKSLFTQASLVLKEDKQRRGGEQ